MSESDYYSRINIHSRMLLRGLAHGYDIAFMTLEYMSYRY